MNLKFLEREFPQKQYHKKMDNIPVLPKNKVPRVGDIWCSLQDDHIVDKVEYKKGHLMVFMTKKRIKNNRKTCFYRCNKREIK